MKLPFEKIYCLHLVECDSRLEKSKNEFKKMEIYDDVEYRFTCKHPYVKEIAYFLKENGKYYWFGSGDGRSYNCTRNWYEIIKTSYLLGYESILCIEDDITFDMPKDVFFHIMNNIPNDYDVIRFGYTDLFCNFKFDKDNCFVENYYFKFWGAQMFALSRKGMKYYIDFLDKYYGVADYPLFSTDIMNEYGIKNYFSTRNFYTIMNDLDSIIYDTNNRNYNKVVLVRSVIHPELYEMTKSYDYIEIVKGNNNFYGKDIIETIFFKQDFCLYYKYVCFIDEDCVFSEEGLNSIIQMMESSDVDIVGVPDGGCVEMRKHRPDVPNLFFTVIKTSKIRNINFDEYNSYEVKNGYECDSFKYDNFEPYYKFFCYLTYGLRLNFFNLNAKQSDIDNITTEVYFDNKLVAAHTWFARLYNTEEHHERINKSINYYKNILQ